MRGRKGEISRESIKISWGKGCRHFITVSRFELGTGWRKNNASLFCGDCGDVDEEGVVAEAEGVDEEEDREDEDKEEEEGV